MSDDTIGFSAGGALIPAFTGSLAWPTSVQLTMPAATTTPLTISSSAGVPLAWTSTPPKSGFLSASIVATASNHGEISCSFDPTSGSGAIPTSLLADFTGESVELVISTMVLTVLHDGDYDVVLVTESSAESFSGTVTN